MVEQARFITEYLILHNGCDHAMKIKCHFKSGKNKSIALLVKFSSVYSKLLTTITHEIEPGTKYPWVKCVQA